MADQAESLRQIVREQTTMAPQSNASLRVVTVTSGKGGVGKSSFTVNFAIALAQQGKRVLILDADFGLANVDILMGIVTKRNLAQVVSGELTMEEVITPGHEGVKFISGGSGIDALLSLEANELDRVVEQFGMLEGQIDILLIDTGAGVNEQVMRMIAASDETIVIMTPEPTSVMDSFALAKAASKQEPGRGIHLVVNRAENQKEADSTAASFSNIVEKYLGVPVHSIGSIRLDKAVSVAVKDQVPYVIGNAHGAAAKDVQQITRRYLNIEDEKQAKGLRKFLQKLRGK